MNLLLTMLLRPLATMLLFVLIVAPASWLLYRLIPGGRARDILFKVRSGAGASTRDKAIMTAGVRCCYGVFAGLLLLSGTH